MVKRFKVWSYKEGEQPLVHFGPVNNIYGIEGQFIDEIEREESPFRATHPDEAHTFFLPVSVANIVHYVYMPITRKQDYYRDRLQRVVMDYIGVVANKYPYWNRSNGADHFMASCHDWVCIIVLINCLCSFFFLLEKITKTKLSVKGTYLFDMNIQNFILLKPRIIFHNSGTGRFSWEA